jgi:sporulation protein YlmC with PRC-barrel domain
MRPVLSTGAALLMAVSSATFAQTTQGASGQTVPAQPAPGQTAPGQTAPGQTAPRQTAPGRTAADQTATGQTVQGAKSNPPSTGTATTNSTDNARAGRRADAGGIFTNVPAQTGLSSKLIGLSVYNNQNTDVGTIKDIAFDTNGVKAYIVGVGGFLGMGDHYVAVRPSAIDIKYDATNDKWKASMNTNVDQLKAAPEFKYSSAG